MAEERTTNAIHGSDDFEDVVLHAKEPVLVSERACGRRRNVWNASWTASNASSGPSPSFRAAAASPREWTRASSETHRTNEPSGRAPPPLSA